jgi:group I intron endonuclease
MGFIYKIVNKINGKIYVGQTRQNLEKRWRQHRKIGSNCRYLKYAFEKYGINNFNFILICVCFDEDLNHYETQYMEKLNSMVPNGYNLKEGGNSGKHHEETKKKISKTLKDRKDIVRTKSQLGKPHSEETKKKISDTLKIKTDLVRKFPSWLGKTHTEKTKKIISEKHKIKINQYDLNNNVVQSFNSISEASKITNIDRSTIGKCCKGMYKTAGNFKWQYL